MLLVLPVSHMDLDRAVRLAARMAKYGGLENDKILVSSTWSAAWDISPLIRSLSGIFDRVLFNKLDTECEMGWPDSANHLFYETALHVEALDLGIPWYFMEADCTPLQPGWFAALKQEYTAAGKPFMGVINKSRWRRPNGEQEVRGRHMVGTGIYPPDFLNRSKQVHQLDITPWDVAIGAEIIADVHDTKLISHHWGCHNARRGVRGLIHVDSIDPTKTYNAGIIPYEAVVCHGVKDLSLDNVLDASESAPS